MFLIDLGATHSWGCPLGFAAELEKTVGHIRRDFKWVFDFIDPQLSPRSIWTRKILFSADLQSVGSPVLVDRHAFPDYLCFATGSIELLIKQRCNT